MSAKFSILDKTAPLRGVFSMRVIARSGKVIREDCDHNMIVNTAREALARLVSEGDQSKRITRFAVGVNDETPTPADTVITGMYRNAIVGHEFPEPGVVRFRWQLGYEEANGMNIVEYGLLCDDDSLFARKTREAIYKASDIAVDGEWSIIF